MDPVDRIIVTNSPEQAIHVLVLDAPELVDEALQRAEQVSVWADDVRDFDALAERLAEADRVRVLGALDEVSELDAVDLAWLRLPKALGALDEYAELVAEVTSEDALFVAAARDRHMTRSMNEVLAAHFGNVSASLGQQKSRALLSRLPYPAELTWPREKSHREVKVGQAKRPITLVAHGATFNTNKIDAGTQLLLDHFDLIADADVYLDLGSGNGVLATMLAKLQPTSEILAIDASWAGVDATARTAAANGVDVEAHWAADLAVIEPGGVDVIVCNPPFHRGVAKESEPTLELFSQARDALSEGGEFWCVYNSHLPWKAELTKRLGPTYVVKQNTGYTLTRTQKD